MGSCQPIDVLADTFVSPGPVVVDSTYAYVSDGPALVRVPLGGGGAQRVANFASTPTQLAIASTGLYGMVPTGSSSGQGLFAVVLVQGPATAAPLAPTVLSSDAGVVAGGSLASAADAVYWLSEDNAPSDASAPASGAGATVAFDLMRGTLPSSPEQVVASGSIAAGAVPSLLNFLGRLAIGGGDAFFGAGGDLSAVRAGTSTFETLTSEPRPQLLWWVAADEGFVYWTTVPFSFSPVLTGTVRRMPRAGGAAQTLASAALSWMTASSGMVWGAQSGAAGNVLLRIGGDGTRAVLAGGLGTIDGIAVDANSVYFTVSGPIDALGRSGRGRLLRTKR